MKTQINTILVPTDFSKLSESALTVGLAIARRQHAEIILIHVVNTIPDKYPSGVFLYETLNAPKLIASLDYELTDLAKKIQKRTGVRITGIVSEGSPADMICKFAREAGISLIVMGTHGTSGVREFFIGSESFKVIKNAICPVLTIPGNWQKTRFEKVLFPVRYKPGTLDKYFYARPIIEKNNSQVMLLCLTELGKAEEKEDSAALMDKLRIQLYTDKVLFQSEFVSSKDFPATIIDNAIEFKADLIVLSANLDYNFNAFFIGPYAQQVVNHSPLPVLTIKPPDYPLENESSLELAQSWGKSFGIP
jgi:nucleotide-binding universal stress UspA family protein